MQLINLTISLFSIIKTKALECISVVNQKCMARPKIIQTNQYEPNEPVFYPLSIKVNKCRGDCNTINNPMANYVYQILLKT